MLDQGVFDFADSHAGAPLFGFVLVTDTGQPGIGQAEGMPCCVI
jgi:hypothetical protein